MTVEEKAELRKIARAYREARRAWPIDSGGVPETGYVLVKDAVAFAWCMAQPQADEVMLGVLAVPVRGNILRARGGSLARASMWETLL